jgi:putative MFS transporter
MVGSSVTGMILPAGHRLPPPGPARTATETGSNRFRWLRESTARRVTPADTVSVPSHSRIQQRLESLRSEEDRMTQENRQISDATFLRSAAVAARIDRIPTGPFHYRLASILGGGTFFDAFDALSIAVVLSLVITTFGLAPGDAGLIISAGFAGQWVGAIVVGALADRIGRRPAFVLSLVVFSVFALVCAFAWSHTSLLVFRALQGLGLGAEVPIATTLINEYLGKRHRGRISVIYQSSFTWGIFFAPLVALATTGVLGPESGWRVLLGLGALPLLIAVWAWFALPESARWLATSGRTEEAEALVGRMEDEAAARGHALDVPEPVPPAAGQDSRLRLTELLAGSYRTRTLGLATIWFTSFFIVYGYLSWLPTMYVSVGQLPASSSLVLTVVLGATQLVVVYTTAWLIDRVGRRPLLLTAFGVAVVGGLFGAVLVGLLGYTSWPVLFTAGIILAIGMSISSSSLFLYTSELFPTRMRGWATSACSSLARLASVVSPIIFGLMLGGYGGPGGVFTAMAIAAAIALAAMSISGVETRNRSLEELSP